MTGSSREARRAELRAWYDDHVDELPRARGRVRHPPRRRHPRRPPRRRTARDADQGRGELPREGHQVRRTRRVQVRRPGRPADRLRRGPRARPAERRRGAGRPPGAAALRRGGDVRPAGRLAARRAGLPEPALPGALPRRGPRGAGGVRPAGGAAGPLDPPARVGLPPARPDVQGRAGAHRQRPAPVDRAGRAARARRPRVHGRPAGPRRRGRHARRRARRRLRRGRGAGVGRAAGRRRGRRRAARVGGGAAHRADRARRDDGRRGDRAAGRVGRARARAGSYRARHAALGHGVVRRRPRRCGSRSAPTTSRAAR